MNSPMLSTKIINCDHNYNLNENFNICIVCQEKYLTSKHDLFENMSGKERINSDKKRLEGQIEHLCEKRKRKKVFIQQSTS